jgi:hypothetical protein
MNKTIRKTKWFWAWQDDKEEAWLEQMSSQGLHLKQAHIFAQYDFFQGQPENYTYRLDFQDALKHKKDEYLRLFADAGWEYLGQMSGWQYFRAPVRPGEEQDIYSDADSKIQKYNRLVAYLSVAFPSYLIVFVALWGSWPEWMMWLNVAVILLCSAFSMVNYIKISQRIKQLKTL